MRFTHIIILMLIIAAFDIQAMPNFARKYSINCITCHNGVPRLNDFGFKFRAAGYRMPEDIGKEETKFSLDNYLAARTQIRADWKETKEPNGAVSLNSKQINFLEETIYPITGAFAKNFSSLVELSILPDNFIEIENAYIKYTTGSENSYFSVKGGVMHPFEGYGASDRPLSLSRPMFQTNKPLNSVYTPWNFDMVGIELGYDYYNTTIRATMFNGSLGTGEPAQGNTLVKKYGYPSYNNKDFQFFVNQSLTENGGGLSGYYYLGWLDQSSTLQNSFNRYAIYASYPIKNFLILGGYEGGKDSFNETSKDTSIADVKSNGYFGELDFNISDPLWIGARYDAFNRLTSDASNSGKTGITAFVNYSFYTGLQFICEYQNINIKKGKPGSQVSNSIQLRMIFIL